MTKKKTFLKVLNWLKDAGFKAFAILLIVAAGFYAFAALDWPDSEPNPTTGVVGMFVGATENTFDAASTYDNVNDWCANGNIHGINESNSYELLSGLGAHICTPDEMINSYNHGSVNSAINQYVTKLESATGTPMLWINNGPPGYTANSNDCLGWTRTSKGTDPQNPNYGAIWNFTAKSGGLSPCKTGKQFACCK